MKPMPETVHLGIISTSDPIRMKNRKLADISNEGLVRLPTTDITPYEISTAAYAARMAYMNRWL